MKKLLFLIVAIILTVSLCACGTAKPLPKQSYKVEEAADDIQGTVDGDVYENEAIGIGFSIPDGWKFYSDSEISSSLNTPVKFSDDPTMQTSEIANYFCDTAAFSEDFKSAVIVTIEEKRESTVGLLPETLMDNTISLAQKDGAEIYDEYEVEKKQFSVGEEKLWGYDAKSTHQKTSLYQRCLLTDNEKYITTVMLTAPSVEALDELTGKFYTLG